MYIGFLASVEMINTDIMVNNLSRY